MNATEKAAAIQNQMAHIRLELDEDVGEVIQQARELANWKNFVRTCPWASVATAAAIGYLVIPQKLNVMSPDAETLKQLAENDRLVVEPKPRHVARAGVSGAAFNLLAGLVMRSVLPIAGNYIGELLQPSADADGESARDLPSPSPKPR